MRWVDIEQLDIPDGWQTQATNALNSLREEIEKAEKEAYSTGADINSARRNAISQGLKLNARQQIWRDLAPYLAKLRNGKCWYSESLNPGSDKNVDHFRPKNAVREDPSHEGYWWLAFDWHNYRYSCQWCNQRRRGATEGGKSDYFPVSGNFRATKEPDDHKREEVDLLDPIDPDDWKLLTFLPNGQPIPAKPEDTKEHRRAEISIRIYHLDCPEFVKGRKDLATKIRLLIENMDILYSQITEVTTRISYKNDLKALLRLIDKDSEYSAAELAYARAEVYKIERGHQVKRDWLEELLNSNP